MAGSIAFIKLPPAACTRKTAFPALWCVMFGGAMLCLLPYRIQAASAATRPVASPDSVDLRMHPAEKVGAVHTGRGHKIVYICDASASMTGAIDRLKTAMKVSVNNLDMTAGQEFEIIFIDGNGQTSLFDDGARIATPENKKAAMDFIDRTVCNGNAHPQLAIRDAVSEEPYIVYVLSDGVSLLNDRTGLDDAFHQADSSVNVHVSFIQLETQTSPSLDAMMRKLANDHHGMYKKIPKSA